MVTEPIHIDHQHLWIWCHYKYCLWSLIENTSGLIRFGLLIIIIIKQTIFLNLSWILHLPNLWHASWLVLKLILTTCGISILHGFNDLLGKYDMSECVEIVILLFLLVWLTFALVDYFDLQMESSMDITEAIGSTRVFNLRLILVLIQTMVSEF